MNKLRYFGIFTVLAFFFLISCNSENEGKKSENLPQARGEVAEIVLVIDSVQWHGDLGKKIREIFTAEIEGLPQPENMFTLRRVSPNKLNNFLRMATNMIFVATLDNNSKEGQQMKKYFTDSSLRTIQENEGLYSYGLSDVYAKGQEILYLFGKTEQLLIDNLEKNQERVQDYFQEIESKRLSARLRKNAEKGLMTNLKQTTGLDMIIPFGYELAHQKDDFMWYRQLDQEREKNVWITWKNYDSEEEFEQKNILPLRDSLARKHIYDVEKPDLFLSSQNQEPFLYRYSDLNSNYGVEIRGLWKYSDNSRGGAFIGYLFLDEEQNRLYYAEGYLDAPGKNKREGMRELHTIIQSIKTQKKSS